MTAHAAVGINDDFASGQARVPFRTADDKTARRVDEDLGFAGEHFFREHLQDELFGDKFFDFRFFCGGRVLGRDDDIDDARRFAVDIFDRHLGFRIGAEPFDFSAFADVGQLPTQVVGKHDGGGHEFWGFVAGEPEHEALVAGTLFRGFFAGGFALVNALCDVRALPC